MSESRINCNAPEIALMLEVDASMRRVLDVADQLNVAVCREVSQGLAEILRTLGIPGYPSVRITAFKESATPEGRFMRLYVNDQACRYSDEMLQRSYSYTTLDRGPKPDSILVWLNGLSEKSSEPDDLHHKRLIEFLSLVCLEAVKRQPAVLLGLDQLLAYQASLPAPANGPNPTPPNETWLLTALRKVLSLKISIADKQVVAKTLREGLAKGRSKEEVGEDLIVALRPDVIEIKLPQEFLRRLTTDNSKNGPDIVTFMREVLFKELGLLYPKFRFVPDENLKPNGFAFKINHLTTLPWISLESDQCLVNDTPERLKLLNIEGGATTNPATGSPGGIIDLKFHDLAETAGLTTWNQMQHLILCFGASLRENSFCFLHYEVVQDSMRQLELAFPELVEATKNDLSIEQITRILRTLVTEEISIRNLRLILERLLDYRYGFDDSSRYLILDDRPNSYGEMVMTRRGEIFDLVSFIRTGMKRQIGNKYSRSTNTLVVYLLDAQIEQILSGGQAIQWSEEGAAQLSLAICEKVIGAIMKEIAHLPATARIPVVLTSVDVRPLLRQVIAPELPRMHVVAYHELATDLNIQPVARISLDT